MVYGGEGLNSFKEGELESHYNEKTLFLTRYPIYNGEHMQARLHLIPDPTEGFIHNHSNSFISYSFSGRYSH
jgi:hypothetical protein